MARQADGAVKVSMGDTTVLVTAVGERSPRAGRDFFPLTVNYVEKTYAAGRIPGGFFKREGRPTEKETLTSRLIDRPIRPLFPDDFFNDVQVVATVLSIDPEIDSDIPALLGASAALAISGIPFNGPIGAARVAEIKAQTTATLTAGDSPKYNAEQVEGALFKLESNIVRQRILNGEPRIDGRDVKTVRPITIKVGVLPRTHGSALFTRGETQALVVTTLGTTRDAQIIDALTGERREPFMLHYNFPPFSVGETGFIGSPKRREIGHGKLARRGVKAVMPNMETFPYVILVVSEITESNGSSSMASVCGTSLSLVD